MRPTNDDGSGVLVGGNPIVSAVYFDAAMSGWLVENNSFHDCMLGVFVNGGCDHVVGKTALFAPFIYKMHYFTKTGSGQT
jgi:hypothetical protein